MKIISNFKDYYDFLQGTWGQDPKAVYERVCMAPDGKKEGIHVPEFMRPSEPNENDERNPMQHTYSGKEPRLYYLAICGTIYCIGEEKRNLYHGPQTWSSPKEKDDGLTWFPFKIRRQAEINHLKKTDLNEKYSCPIILTHPNEWCKREDGSWGYGALSDVLNPRLKDFQFAKVVPPEQMFLMLTNFLLNLNNVEEKPIDPKEKNKQRIVAHGFDLKTSFRKPKQS